MIQSEEGRREHDMRRIEWAFSSALFTPFLALSLVLLLLLSFPLSYFVARTFGLLRILITRWETTKMKGGADEDYSFLFKGERVMENMSVSFCHFQKVFHVVHHHQKSF